MKILAKYITTTTQIHNGKCYFLGMQAEGSKVVLAYNIEDSGTAAAGNQVAYLNSSTAPLMLPKPGVECTNGLNIVCDANVCVYYSLG